MLQNWIRPLNKDQYSAFTQNGNTIGAKTSFFTLNTLIPEKSIALVGLNEVSSQKIRNQIYQFQPTSHPIHITDLGHIRNRSEDFLTSLIAELQESNITTILIGLSTPVINAQIQGMRALEKPSKLCLIDNKPHSGLISARNAEALESLALIGTQKHLFQEKTWIEYSSLEKINMGTLKNDLIEAEPALRDCNALSFSIEAINKNDAPGQRGLSNTKLSAYEACQLMHYAGFNQSLSSIAFSNYLPELDQHSMTANLIAQMIWYYLDATSMSLPDHPSHQNNTQNFSVLLEEHNLNISFVKSLASGKWWIKRDEGKYISCSENDYRLACANAISPRLSHIFF